MALTYWDWVSIVKTSRALLGRVYFGDVVRARDFSNRAHLFEDFAYICSKFYGCGELGSWVNALRKPQFGETIQPQDHNDCLEIAKGVKNCLSKHYNVQSLSQAISRVRTVSYGDSVLASDWNNLLDVADEIIALLEIGFTLTVHVVDVSTGNPIPNAKVTVNSTVKYTDSNGYAIFSKLAPSSTVTVTVEAPNYETETTTVVMDTSKTLEVKLERLGYTLTVHVIDAFTKDPIPNAEVTVDSTVKYTDEEGNAVFEGLEKDKTVTVHVVAEGYFDYTTKVLMDSDKTITVELEPTEVPITCVLEFYESWEWK